MSAVTGCATRWRNRSGCRLVLWIQTQGGRPKILYILHHLATRNKPNGIATDAAGKGNLGCLLYIQPALTETATCAAVRSLISRLMYDLGH